MLRLDGGAMGDLVGRTMLVEVMNRIVELDVSFLYALKKYWLKKYIIYRISNVYMACFICRSK